MTSVLRLAADDALAVDVATAVTGGDVAALTALLAAHPDLARARIVREAGDAKGVGARTLLHVATDWPGHFPNVADVIRALVAAGADVNAKMEGAHHEETPLHWAASTDDVAALDALLDAGADLEAGGSVLGGGTPLADAVAFRQWNVARRLVERGASANLWQAAGLGLLERVRALVDGASADDVTNAFWCACHGGQRDAAALLLARGADRDWVGHDGLTPLGAAERAGAADVVAWLRSQGAR